MLLISHRGNLNGIQKKRENSPTYINEALSKGYDVEVDVRFTDDKFFLGHDTNQYKVNKEFLENKRIWCHAKTVEALMALEKTNAHYFWHQEDDYTITSKGFIWTYPGKKLFLKRICVLPEKFNYEKIKCTGICSDFIEKYN